MPSDLVVLVPDKNFEYGVRGLLSRPDTLGIREIDFRVIVHPKRDPGCARTSHEILRLFCRNYDRALLLFDKEGSGCESQRTDALTEVIRNRLSANGWGDRADVIVLEPELEAWIFPPTAEVQRCLGWNQLIALRVWLETERFCLVGHPKPRRPKEALERILFTLRRPRSSSIYECLGRSVNFQACADPAFQKFWQILAAWFPAAS